MQYLLSIGHGTGLKNDGFGAVMFEEQQHKRPLKVQHNIIKDVYIGKQLFVSFLWVASLH